MKHERSRRLSTPTRKKNSKDKSRVGPSSPSIFFCLPSPIANINIAILELLEGGKLRQEGVNGTVDSFRLKVIAGEPMENAYQNIRELLDSKVLDEAGACMTCYKLCPNGRYRAEEPMGCPRRRSSSEILFKLLVATLLTLSCSWDAMCKGRIRTLLEERGRRCQSVRLGYSTVPLTQSICKK